MRIFPVLQIALRATHAQKIVTKIVTNRQEALLEPEYSSARSLLYRLVNLSKISQLAGHNSCEVEQNQRAIQPH